MKKGIDKYQKHAEKLDSTLNVSGGFPFWKEAMKLVVLDITCFFM